MSKKLNLSKKLIIKKYVKENKSLKQVAKELGCGRTTLTRYLKKYKIKKRNKYDLHRKNINFSKEFLLIEYKDKTAEQIAKEEGCGRNTVIRYLRKFIIRVRTHSETKKITFKGNKNPSFRYDLQKDFLIKNYVKGKKSSTKCATLFGCSSRTILRALKKSGIKTRTQQEAQKGLRMGPANPNWIDGRSFLPYPPAFNNALKAKIRKRDNYICQVCGMTEEEHLVVYGCNLTIHHADYDKNNCEESNLFSTCFACNARVNFNRGYWKDFLKNKLRTKNGRI